MEQNFTTVSLNISNPFLSYQVTWTQWKIFSAILFGSFTFVTVFANLFVLYLFAKGKRSLRAPSHYLLANLAVADLLVGVLVMPIISTLAVFEYHWFFGRTACAYVDHIHFMLRFTSTISIVAVSLERYIGVKYPLRHKKLQTKRRLISSVIIGIWILSLAVTWTPLTVWRKTIDFIESSGTCAVNMDSNVTLYVSIAVYTIPVCITLGSYTLIYWYVYEHYVVYISIRCAFIFKLLQDRIKSF